MKSPFKLVENAFAMEHFDTDGKKRNIKCDVLYNPDTHMVALVPKELTMKNGDTLTISGTFTIGE